VIEGHDPAEVNLPVSGRHMVANALLAAGASSVLGLSAAEIAAGLTDGRTERRTAHPERPPGRGDSRRQLQRQSRVDGRRAGNPGRDAGANGGRRIAVLGHMAELGGIADEAHQKVGRLAAERGLQLAAIGELARPILEGARAAGGRAEHFTAHGEAAEWLAGTASAGDVVLFKGSRTAAVETVLKQAFPED
jgi:UDP-N-acetylmuramoyl-tripeptide--D-alanyl-D-alanine ligase